MVEIEDKHKCCGCSACVSACPQQCVAFDEDDKGFRYPVVDTTKCIDCGICEKVCPCLHQGIEQEPLCVFSAVNPDLKERESSSSGGIFIMLARNVLRRGGIVFGAKFDDKWEVCHTSVESEKELQVLLGSKYVQSRIEDTYKQAKKSLQSGREVLFSGTPCQIAGLHYYLRKEYPNLLMVEVVCHGVPSPRVWRNYLEERFDVSQITDISFRDKSTGWLDFSLRVDLNGKLGLLEPMSANIYMKAFLCNLSLRPSCYNCPAKSGKSHADIALADFWGVQLMEQSNFDNKGTSLILSYTDKGEKAVAALGCAKLADVNYAMKYNAAISHSVDENKYVESFWIEFDRHNFKRIHKITTKFEAGLLTRLKGWMNRNIIKKIK